MEYYRGGGKGVAALHNIKGKLGSQAAGICIGLNENGCRIPYLGTGKILKAYKK
jgi:hypothetical protein